MALSVVRIPFLRFSSRRSDLEVISQGSLSVDLPAKVLHGSTPLFPTPSDLMKAAEDKQLWINRVGACFLRLSTSFDAEDHNPPSHSDVRDWIRGAHVWDRLGLRLVEREGESEDLVFSLQHPDLSSSLTPPKGALRGELKEVRVSLNFSRKSTRRSRMGRKGGTFNHDSYGERNDHGTTNGHNLDSDDLRAIEEFLSRAGIQQIRNGCLATTSSPPSPKNASELRELSSGSEILKSLTLSAIDVLLFGKTKRHIGIRWVEGNEWVGLVHIAPAVFHVPFLQTVAQKARLMPTIATSLARMVNAESPSLRKLVTNFEHLQINDYERAGDLQTGAKMDVVTIIEGSIWRTLVNHTEIPKVVLSKTKRKRAGSIETESMPPTLELLTSQSHRSLCPMDIASPDLLLTVASRAGRSRTTEDDTVLWNENRFSLVMSEEITSFAERELFAESNILSFSEAFLEAPSYAEGAHIHASAGQDASNDSEDDTALMTLNRCSSETKSHAMHSGREAGGRLHIGEETLLADRECVTLGWNMQRKRSTELRFPVRGYSHKV